MALGSRSVGYHSAVRGPGPPSLHPSNEPGPQNLIAAMLFPLATPGRLPLVNSMPALFWQLGDVARNAPRFVHHQHMRYVSIGSRLAAIDEAIDWP